MAGSESQEVKRKGKGKLREGRTKGGRSRGKMQKKRKKTDFFCQSESRTDYPVGAWLHPQAVFQMSVCSCVCVCFGSVCVCWTLQSLGATLYQHRVVFRSPAFALTHSRALFVSFFRLTHSRCPSPVLLFPSHMGTDEGRLLELVSLTELWQSNNDNFGFWIAQNSEI